MINEFRKSVQSILYERISSPLSGAFFFSWLVWNWKIPYYLFGSDYKLSLTDRLAYIDTHLLTGPQVLLYPIISTILIICIYPFISTGAYWVWLKFKKLQNKIKNKIEKQRLLTLEESNRLREEIAFQEQRTARVVEGKENEIIALKKRIDIIAEESRSISGDLDGSRQKADILKQELDSNQEKITELEGEKQSLFDKNSTLGKEFKSLRQEMDTLKRLAKSQQENILEMEIADYSFKKELVTLIEQKELLEKENKVLSEKIKKHEKEPPTDEARWKAEFIEFARDDFGLGALGRAKNNVSKGLDLVFNLPADSIDYLEATEIITIVGPAIYEFTKKGKFFAKLYLKSKFQQTPPD